MSDLRNTTEMVWEILTTEQETRSSDTILYIEVLKCYSAERGFDITSLPFDTVLRNLKTWGIPTIETVGRCRRKLQHDNPELNATEEMRLHRAERKAEFLDYATDGDLI